MTPVAAGQVWAHVGQEFGQTSAPTHYDLLIVGAGRMGAALARFLREAAPQLSLLLAEEGGLPNEEGATILAPGVWHGGAPPEQQERAEQTRNLLTEFLGDGFNPCGLIELRPEQTEGFQATADLMTPELETLIDPAELPFARLDARAATYSAGTLALTCANAAIRAGADLMLNVRAELCGTTSGGRAQVKLHRLSVTNTHEIVVGQTATVTAGRVVVAAGAAGPHLAEVGLGVVTPHRMAYRQAPRLEVSSGSRSPVISALGVVLRPRDGGYTVVPPMPHPDPWGYVPTGGRLVGVPVGLRRETLDAVLAAMNGLPALATEALMPGRSLADIPGAWVALPEGGWPLWQRLDGAHWLLLGGEMADLTGLSVARELAQELTKELALK